jgi:nitrogen fixation protein NifU and related proteins
MLYPHHILDHGQNPRNRGVLDPADVESAAAYPLCGDHLHLTLRFDENRHISAIAWDGDGCIISLASASMLGECVLGKSLDEVRRISRQDILDMLDVPILGNRVKCALLPLQAVVVALYGPDAWQQHEDIDK